MIVALAGSDGVGKTTILLRLVDELISNGHSARAVGRWDIVDNPAYPSTRFLKADIRDLRNCVAAMPPTPRLMFLLWTMHMSLSPYDAEGERSIIIVDGYWMKHAASEIAYGVDESYVAALTDRLPRADLTFLLDAPLEHLYERKAGDLVPYECGMDPACSRESFITHQTKIRATLARWTAAFGWTSIDVARPVDQIVRDLAAAIQLRAMPASDPDQRVDAEGPAA
jgi:dTMP kinase